MKKTIFFVFALCLICGVLSHSEGGSGQTSAENGSQGVGLSGSWFKPPVVKPTPPVGVCLDNVAGKYIFKKYTLTTGQVEITFKVQLDSKVFSKKPVVKVQWNGKVVYTIYACDNGKFVKLLVNSCEGVNILKFVALGGPVCKFCIKDFCAVLKTCNPAWGSDVICNGKFDQNSCGGNVCFWSATNISSSVPCWIPSPEIEIGKGNNYNALLGSNNWVASLSTTANTCIKQKVLIAPGNYRLSFTYAATQNRPLTDSSFTVKINGGTIAKITPEDYLLHTEKIFFTLNSWNCPRQSYVEFCGTGTGTGANAGFGVAIDDVKLQTYNACAQIKTITLN